MADLLPYSRRRSAVFLLDIRLAVLDQGQTACTEDARVRAQFCGKHHGLPYRLPPGVLAGLGQTVHVAPQAQLVKHAWSEQVPGSRDSAADHVQREIERVDKSRQTDAQRG